MPGCGEKQGFSRWRPSVSLDDVMGSVPDFGALRVPLSLWKSLSNGANGWVFGVPRPPRGGVTASAAWQCVISPARGRLIRAPSVSERDPTQTACPRRPRAHAWGSDPDRSQKLTRSMRVMMPSTASSRTTSTPACPTESSRYASSRSTPSSNCGMGRAMISDTGT